MARERNYASMSVRKETLEKLQKFAETNDVSTSAVLDAMVNSELLDKLEIEVTKVRVKLKN